MSLWSEMRKGPVASARRLAAKGRNGDTELVHMSREEIRALSRLGRITRNPKTGLLEMFSLGGALGALAGGALAAFTGGLSIPVGAAIGGGLGGYASTGTPSGALQGAALGYGGGSLVAGGLGAAGAGATGGAGGVSGVDAWDLSNPMVTDPSTGAYISGGGPLISGGAPVSDRSFDYTGTGLSRGPVSNLLSFPGAAMNFLSQGGFGGGAGALPWGSPGNLLTVGSGIYGLMEADRLRKLSAQLAAQSDPNAQYRPGYAAQLNYFANNPGAITSMPNYQAGLEAVQRAMGAQGYQGSGNMALALAKYGGDFYTQNLQNYGNLAGIGFNPGTAAGLNLEGQYGSANLALNSAGLLGRAAMLAGR